MNRGYSHSKASPMADFIAFRKIRDKLGGRIRLLVSGGAPLSPEIEEFLRVTCCCFVVQGYGIHIYTSPLHLRVSSLCFFFAKESQCCYDCLH